MDISLQHREWEQLIGQQAESGKTIKEPAPPGRFRNIVIITGARKSSEHRSPPDLQSWLVFRGVTRCWKYRLTTYSLPFISR